MVVKIIMLAGVLLFFFLADFVFGNTSLSANCKSGLLVVVGPLLGTMLTYRLPIIKALFQRIVKMFKQEGEAKDFVLINEIEELANAWHTGGHRRLEIVAGKTTSSLLRTGAGMIADGYKVGEIRKILSRQCKMYFADRAVEGDVLLALGKYTQAFGYIGTVVGMIRVFESIGDPVAIGNGLAIALLSTLHGLLLANFVYMPLHKKFENHMNDEYRSCSLILEGINSLALGKSSRAISYRLNSFLGNEHEVALPEKQIATVPHQHFAGAGVVS